MQTILSLADSIQLSLATMKQSMHPELSTLLSTVHTSTTAIQDLTATAISAGLVSEFIFFPKLPVKLRQTIWEAALPGPRILELFYESDFDDEAIERKNEVIRANLVPPTVLHVCRESRQVALKKYMGLGASYTTCFTLFNPAEDTIYFPWSKDGVEQEAMILASVFSVEATLSIKYMAMDYRMWKIFGLGALVAVIQLWKNSSSFFMKNNPQNVMTCTRPGECTRLILLLLISVTHLVLE